MLQQSFTPLYNKTTAPFVEAPQVTVKYPALYRVSKGNQVHHLLGHIHAIPLAFMPEYVLQIIQHSQCLLTEGFAILPPEFFTKMISENPCYGSYTFSFTYKLKEEVKTRFTKDILELLEVFTNTDHQHLQLENLSLPLLETFFKMFIENRINPEQLIIDTALVQLFKNQAKRIIELNDPSKEGYVNYCKINEQELQNHIQRQGNEIHHLTLKLSSLAETINKHYSNTEQCLLLQNETVKQFLETDIEKEGVTLDTDFLEQVKTENQLWLKVFLNQHNQGTNNMLLACGYNHLLIPEQGLLQLLAEEGFSIERVCDPQLENKHTVKLRTVV
ncbi:TraB/GumN family protein [Candidatus Berkiella aquae]|uniref:TraB/GumN family protein n=1 Tax=Candidatus Berkiella aquae TaxID=295108 RepID=A0A0Q9YKY0_9GAMM|nr:TraB/GumN family protein [Candidatus Berkiella aquae]MCS5710892.1 TraB/GumN family protein [Candidatus Berkiella aquae]